MQPSDIGALVVPGDPRVSPDGSMVAYTVTTVDLAANAYRSTVWLAGTTGAPAPRPFTSGGDARDAKPRWSPDGTRLAFVSHRQQTGSEALILPFGGGGEAITVARWREEIEDLAWSPDGTRLALLTRAPDPERYGPLIEGDRDRPPRRLSRFTNRLDNVGWTQDRPLRVHVIAADGSGQPVEVAGPGAPDADANGVAWSPDGASLAWCQAVAADWDLSMTQPLIVAPVTGGPARVLASGAALSRPSFSPDGTSIAAVTADRADPPRNSQIVLLATSGDDRAPTVLTAGLDRNCAPVLAGARRPVWAGIDVWFQVEDHGAVHLFRAETAGAQATERVVGGDVVVTGFDVAAGTVVFTAACPTSSGELFVIDRHTGDHRRLTAHGEALRDAIDMPQPEHFVVPTGDGDAVDAWYLPPTGPPTEPPTAPSTGTTGGATLLNIHGGPFSQYTTAFFDEFAIQAGAGYGVLWCNPRGSSGRSEAWGRSIRGPRCATDPGSGWGAIDADDVLAVADAAIERFGLDPTRIGVLGGSYGGYLTSWLIGHTDRFAAACSERAVNNQLTMVWTSDIGTSFQRGYVGVSHLDAPEEYLRMSPVTYVRDMTTPLLILHSDGDLRCPVSQGEELWTALRMLDRQVEFVRFPGAGHELSRSGPPKQRVWRAEVILDWFDRHLGTSPC
jgi:dipeptidyl aminopeptidase/acylaminoacyl peptidase